ncbi:MAG: TonB family protein [Thermodesulfovibrionales bacterium]|jgi:TonB family protein|nr:TonB family protein [Thermodesulfovibrionales bacterium]
MFRGTDIEVLARQKIPLFVSLLFHAAAIALAFSITGYESETVFTVELKEIGWKESANVNSKNAVRRTIMSDHKKPEITSGIKKQSSDTAHPASYEQKPEQNPDDEKIAESREFTKTPPVDNPASVIAAVRYFAGGQKTARVSTPSGIKEGEDTGRIGASKATAEAEFGSDNAPSFAKRVMPEYPRLARRLGREGKVVLRLFINEHGRLVSVEIVEKAGHGFDEAAIDAVKASTFRPAKLNGHSVACRAVLPVRFRLE